VDFSSLLSDLRLGIRAVFILPLQRVFQSAGGLDRFEKNFFPERLLPTTRADRERMKECSRCVACGLCDAAFAEAGAGERPSLLPMVFSRSKVELPFAADDVRRLASSPELLRAAERLCPTGVPLERLARWLEQRSGVPPAQGRES
jgi:hypothetical protein